MRVARSKYEQLKAHPELQKGIETVKTKLQEVRNRPEVQKGIENARNTFSTMKQKFQGQQAGKRLSRKKHLKSKWGTQRQSAK
jgi:hypothetical protein